MILCCAALAALGYEGPPPLTEMDGRSPIRMGGELLGGYRSHYVYRGEKMGNNSVEGQISGGFSLSDYQGWHKREVEGLPLLSETV